MKSMISIKKPSVISRIMALLMVTCMCIVPAFALDISQKATNVISGELTWVAIASTIILEVCAYLRGSTKAIIPILIIGALISAIVHDPQYIILLGQKMFNLIK